MFFKTASSPPRLIVQSHFCSVVESYIQRVTRATGSQPLRYVFQQIRKGYFLYLRRYDFPTVLIQLIPDGSSQNDVGNEGLVNSVRCSAKSMTEVQMTLAGSGGKVISLSPPIKTCRRDAKPPRASHCFKLRQSLFDVATESPLVD